MTTTHSLRHPCPSDVTDAEAAFVARYLTLITEAAPQRHHDLRGLLNALRRMVRTGTPGVTCRTTSRAESSRSTDATLDPGTHGVGGLLYGDG